MNKENKNVVDTLTSSRSTSNDNFSRYIKNKQKSILNPVTQKRWSTQELAEALTFGSEYDRFRKIVNMSRPTHKRDIIVAICVVLQMTVDEANHALILYKMPTLDSSIKRDMVFIQALENHQAKSFGSNKNGQIDYVENIDNLLRSHGCNALDLHKQTTTVLYTSIKQSVDVISDEVFYGLEYDSLSAKYRPEIYRCKSSLLLVNQETKHRLLVIVTLSVNEYTYWIDREADGRIEKFDTHTSERELLPFFKEAHHAAMNKLYSLLRILDDSRNYHFREGARYEDGEIHFYLESFNYDIPELNEYCLIEKTRDATVLSVYDHSEFIYHHIGSEEYNRIFGVREHKPLHTFSSLDDLSDKASCKPNEIDRIHYSIWRSIFKELLLKLDQLRDDLLNHRKYIKNLDELDDSDINVCDYYKLDNDCICSMDSDGVFRPNSVFVSSNENGIPKTELSIEDLRLAYQLGIPDMQSVCQAINKFGTIWDILY